MGLATNWPISGELWGSGDVSDRAVSAVPDRSEIGPYLRTFGPHLEAHDSRYGTMQLGGTGGVADSLTRHGEREARSDWRALPEGAQRRVTLWRAASSV